MPSAAREFNPQQQPRIVWPANAAVARAYLDQLVRSNSIAVARASALRVALDKSNRAVARVDRRRTRDGGSQHDRRQCIPTPRAGGHDKGAPLILAGIRDAGCGTRGAGCAVRGARCGMQNGVWLSLVCALLFISTFVVTAQSPISPDAPELRALWVDAFHEGIRSAREADDLVAAARRANINTLIVQVRRRGDALYTKGSSRHSTIRPTIRHSTPSPTSSRPGTARASRSTRG